MRLVHTADWHLGRTFNGHRLLDDQAEFLDWLLDFLVEKRADLLLIAGDIFDRSVAPEEAVELYSNTIERIVAAGIDVAAISGNHDSAVRLRSLSELHDGKYMIAGGYRDAGKVVVREYETGPVSIVSIPYLNPLQRPISDANSENDWGSTHESVAKEAVRIANRKLDPAHPVIAMSHSFIASCQESDSERLLSVGATPLISASIFSSELDVAAEERKPYDYVALGHLHRPQLVGDDPTIRYSGSPLAYSFSENRPKEVVVVDIDSERNVKTETVPIPVGRRVESIKGSFLEILNSDRSSDAWVSITLTDTHPIIDARSKLRSQFPYLVEVIQGALSVKNEQTRTLEEIKAMTPLEAATEFLSDLGPVSESDTEILESALDKIMAGNR